MTPSDNLKEFGSDFHLIDSLKQRKTEYELAANARYYTNGRQAIQDLIRLNEWKRIWMPEYFCYDIINAIKETGIEVMYYYDKPQHREMDVIASIQFNEGDVLLRMNYFGLRTKRSNKNITVPVIEDHSHDLIGDWASNSNADWCIASLRKSLPIAEGGILWSPKGHILPEVVATTESSNELASKRYDAMRKKADYLKGEPINKEEFLKVFAETENGFTGLSLSGLSKASNDIITSMDIKEWYELKKANWTTLYNELHQKINILVPEEKSLYPFSLVVVFNDRQTRDAVRQSLIERKVYPAILWNIPTGQNEDIIEYADRALSIHCDARYNEEDIKILSKLIADSLSAS